MIPKTHNFAQWRNRYYHICKLEGISRNHSITSHGLRHERLNEIYETMTGEASPIKGGKTATIAEHLKNAARQEVAELAGHSRASIAGSYLGK